MQNFTGDPIPDKKKGVEFLERPMFISADVPDLSGISFKAMSRVNYSAAIPFLTIPEANLRLYMFNDSTDTWELTAGSGVDTTNKIVFGNVTGFGIFGVMGGAAAAVAAGGNDVYYYATPIPANPSTVASTLAASTPNAAVTSPTTTPLPQPTVSTVSTPTERAQQGGTLTGIILGILLISILVLGTRKQ